MVLPHHKELLQHFSSFLFESGLSSVSIKNYLSDLRHFFSSFPDKTASDLFTGHNSFLSQYLKLQKATFTPQSTTNRRLASIRRFNTFLQAKYTTNNVFSYQNISNEVTKCETTPLTFSSSQTDHNQSSLPSATSNQDSNLHHQQTVLSSEKIVEQFRRSLESEKKSNSTIKNYISDINHFLLWTANKTPFTVQNLTNILSKLQLDAYVTYLKLSHTSTSVINRRQSSIKKLARYCHSSGYLQENPLDPQPIIPKLSPLAWFERLTQKKQTHPRPQNKISIWHDRYNSLPWAPYLNLAILVIATTTMAIFAYNQVISNAKPSSAATSLTPPKRQLSFQGRLVDSSGTPITTAVNVIFRLYDDLTPPGTQLYTSNTCSITPDQDGIFNTLIGDGTCGSEISASVFSDNQDVFLEIQVGSETLTPRQQIATVGYALNSETLQGYPAAAPATINTVPVVDNNGDITISAASPSIISTSGTFSVSGQSLALQTAANSGGDIVLQPDALSSGQIQAIGGTTTEDSIRITNANLTSGALVSGYVGNDTAIGRLLSLSSGSSETDRFWVTAKGRAGVFASSLDSALTINQTSTGDLIAASVSGVAKFTVNNTGAITTIDGVSHTIDDISGDLNLDSAGGDVLIGSSDNLKLTAASNLIFGTTTLAETTSPTDSGAYLVGVNDEFTNSSSTNVQDVLDDLDAAISAASSGTGPWTEDAGILYPKNSTVDLLVGGQATSSAKFAVINLNNGTPTASVSAGVNGAASLTATGVLATTAKQSLILGDSNTGNIILAPGGVTSLTAIGANLTAAGNFTTTDNSWLGLGSSAGQIEFDDQATDEVNILNANLGLGTNAPDAALEINQATGDVLRLTYNDNNGGATAYTDFSLASDGDLTIDSAGGAISLGSGDDLNLSTANDLIFAGTTALGETTSPTDSGAYLVGTNDEFDNSNSSNVQAVLNDLDAAITSVSSTGPWVQGSGILYPKNSTVDLLVGGQATSSAKISFINMNSGTPTINVANQATNLSIKDNTASSFKIVEGANTYLDITTTNDAETMSLNLPAGGATSHTANLFNASIAQTINLGTGTAIDTINIGTGASGADVITIGGGSGTVAINSGDWDITTTGNVSGIGSITADGNLTLSGTSANILLGSNYLSGDGGDEGISVDASGNVTVSGNLLAIGDTQDIGDSTNSWAKLYLNTGIHEGIAGTEVISILNKRLTGGAAWNIVTGVRIGDTSAITAGYELDLVGDAQISGNINSAGNTTLGSGASSVNTIGSTTTPGALTLHGATTLDNTFTVSGNNLTSLGGNLTVSGTTWTATPTISGLITATSGLTANGTLTANGNTQIGNAITDTIDFQARVLADSDLIPIGTTGTNDLGSSALPWDNLYLSGDLTTTATSGTQGWWKRLAGNLSPINQNDTLSATTSAAVAMTITQTGAFDSLLVQDAASDTTPFVIDQSGNVGIGTTTPASVLDVRGNTIVGDGTAYGDVRLVVSDTTGDNDSSFLAVKNDGTTNPAFSITPTDDRVYIGSGLYLSGGAWQHSSDSVNSQLLGLIPGTGANWWASSNSSSSFNVAANVALWDSTGYWKNVVQSSATGDSYFTGGSVGIGIAAPLSKLQIVDTSAAPNSAGFLRLTPSGTATVDLRMGIDNTNDFAWIQAVNTGVNYTEELVLNGQGGNVGVGDTSPAALFTVGSGDLFQVGSDGAITFNNTSITNDITMQNSANLNNNTSGVVETNADFRALGGTFYGSTNDTTTSLISTGHLAFHLDNNVEATNYRFLVYDDADSILFDINEAGTTDMNTTLQLNLARNSETEAVCHNGTDVAYTNKILADCVTSVNADYAEIYPSVGEIEYGELVMASEQYINADHPEVSSDGSITSAGHYQIPKVKRSTNQNTNKIIGITSNNWSDFSSTGGQSVPQNENPIPVALNGRVPLKISTNSLAIEIGDPITASEDPGKGTKATLAGRIFGTALERWNPQSPTDKILVFVNNTFFDPDLALNNSGDIQLISTNTANYAVTTPTGISQRIGTFAETITAHFQAGVALVKDLTVDKLIVKTKLISPIADIDQLKVIDATVSGTLYANKIEGQTISTLDSKLDLLDEKYSTASAILADLQAKYSAYDTLLGSTHLSSPSADPLATSPLATSSADLTADNLITTDLLSSQSIFTQSISSLDSDLYIQPTADQPVHFMANLMTLYPNGQVAINGDLLITGTIYASNIDTKTATVSGSLAVGSIDSTGSANFSQLITGGLIIASNHQDSSATVSAETATNTTIGTATIASGSSEIIIANNKVTDHTLIYITPVSDTNNQVLFVKSKQSGNGFTVAIPGNPELVTQDISFNYWLVETK